MEKLCHRLRHIIPMIILLIIVAAVCRQAHHHDCHGLIRVALVESHECHHHSSPVDGHHPHTCDGGCSVMIASAIIEYDNSDTGTLFFHTDHCGLSSTPYLSAHSGQSYPIVYPRFIPDEIAGVPSVIPLRGPPQC